MSAKKNENQDAEEILNSIPRKSVKKTTKYTVLLIPDSTDHARSFELTFDHILRIIVAIAAVCIILISFLVAAVLKNYRLSHDETQTKKIAQLNEEIERLKQDKTEMYEQIVSLTDLVAEKQDAEREMLEEQKADYIRFLLRLLY